MSQNRLPVRNNPLKHITDLSIKPMAELAPPRMDAEMINDEPKEDVRKEDVFKKYQKEKKQVKQVQVKSRNQEENIKLETIEEQEEQVDVLENNTDLDLPEDKMRGQRGKDKQKRKKKILTKSQLDGLAAGRLKSIETRKKNKENRKKASSHLDIPPQMEAPKKNTKLDYDTFSNYMDMYEEKRKKKHSNTKEPHPNKAIPSRMRPTPPISQPRIAKWTGNASTFAQHQKPGGNGRWNYGV